MSLSAYSATYYSIGNGNWNSNTTWSTGSGGGAVAAGVYPVSGDVVYIEGGDAITVNADAACASITFRNSGNLSLTLTGTSSLIVTGALTMNRPSSGFVYNINVNAGTLTAGSLIMSATTNSRFNNINITTGAATFGNTTTAGASSRFILSDVGTLNFNGTTTWSGIPTLTTVAGSTVNYSRSGAQTGLVTTYGNLTISGSGVNTFSATPTVNGVLSLEGTATVSVTNGVVTYGPNATLQYNTNTSRTASAEEWITPFAASGGVKIKNTGAIAMDAAKVFNANIPLTIDNGSTLTPGANLLTLGGDFTNNGAFTSGSGGVTIAGTATAQNIGGFTTTGTVSMTKTSGVATLTGNVNGGALTINGSGGTLNLGAELNHTFSGIVTLTAGTLNGGSSTLNVNATSTTAWNGSGTVFTPGTGTVNFGGVAQTLSASATTFNNLTFSGGGAKTLGSSTIVNGTLTLTSGLLTLGSNNLTLGVSSPAIAGTFGAANMIVATGTGELRKMFVSSGSYLFPVGDATGTAEYSPMTLNFTSGVFSSAYAGVRVINEKHPNSPITSNYLNRYWSVSQSGISSFSCNVTGAYQSADIVGTQSSMVAARYFSSLPWIKYATLGSNTLTATAVTSFGDFTGIDYAPNITTSVGTLTGFTYPFGIGPSSEKSFTVSGSELTANIILTPASDYEISTGTGGSFVPSSLITLTATGGTVSQTSIYVRLKSELAIGSYSTAEIIDITSTGAEPKSVSCSGTVSNPPVISPSISTLNGFSYTYTAGPSAQQSFTVTGSNLPANVMVTPPADFEISTTSGSGFQSTPISLTPAGGTLGSTTIYVRMKIALGVGNYSENIVLSTTGASSNVSCVGVVNTSPTLTTNVSYLGGFMYTAGSGPSGEQSFVINGSSLTSNVSVSAPANFEISTTSGSGFSTTALTLTPSGGIVNRTIYVRLVAGLAAGSYGPSNVSLASTGAVVKTVALAGSVVSTASIATSKTTLTGFGYMFGTGPSAEQSFTVSGSSLTSAVMVTPPANFEISTTSGSGFISTALNLPITSGRLNPTTIYVRLKSGLIAGNYTGVNVSVASTGVTTKNVACVGIVFVSPLITAGGGGSFCEGSTINLTSAGADIQNRYWQGPTNYYSSAQNPTLASATPSMSGTYTVTGNVYVGGNLITNGDFETGNTSFGSSYTYVVPGKTVNTSGNLWPENYYTVDASPQASHTMFSACPDHTIGGATPVGKQMIVNGAATAGVVVWSQSVPVVPGASYEFSYWVQTVVATSPSQLQLYANGVAAGPTYTADLTTCTWKQFIYNTTAGATTSFINLELINQNTIANGNDFALDDIVFKQILPATSSVNVTVNPTLPVSVSVAASANPVFSNTPVVFTATPTNGGTAPAYQWKVNGVNVGTNSTTYTYSPKNGDNITCVLTSDYACPTGNPATSSVVMTVNTRVNYWMGAIDTDWAKPGNWTANFVPLTGDDVEYATVSNFGSLAVNDLKLDQHRTIGSLINATTKRLIIPARVGLTVNNTILTDGNPDRIYIHCDSLVANGSLIFHNLPGSPVSATVEMYSKASWDLTNPVSSNRYHWQYFGIPLQSVVAEPTFNGSFVRRWEETGTAINNHWIQLNNNSTIVPFYGYELCQKSPKVFYFKGKLVNSDFASGQLAVTQTALYPGQHIFANPYTAAIDIRQLSFGPQTEQSVYMYNTGTYSSWTNGGVTAPGNNPGQYTASTKVFAGSNGLPRQIPSMQAMLVKAMTASSAATFGIDYNSVVMTNSVLQRIPSAKDGVSSENVSTLIDLKGLNGGDRMWLFSDPKCTRGFDNGWDGPKMLGTSLSPQLYAIGSDGNYQINAVADINDTQLAFQAGTDVEYTMTFTHENVKRYYPGVYLIDEVEHKTIDITESGSKYTFMAESTPKAVNRFKIATRHYDIDPKKDTELLKVFCSSGMIFVHNFSAHDGNAMIFDISGHFIKKVSFSANGVTEVSDDMVTGAYIVKCVTETDEVTKRIIVR